MSTPSHDCDRYREELLLGTEPRVPAGTCGDCAAHGQRLGQVRGLLGSLERHPAPAALDEALADALDLGVAGQEPLLRGLERLSAPVALDEALAAELAHDHPSETPAARMVGRLERHPAPAVLDRLVAEELADPAADTRRHLYGLFRQSGPRSLADRVDRELRGPVPRRRLGLTLGGLAAAALLVVTALPLLQGPQVRTSPRFEVVEVRDLDGLDPFARSLVEGLAGGKVELVRPDDQSGTGSLTDGGGR